MRYRHAIALETGQQQQNIFLVRAFLDLETDILWQLHWLLLPKHVVVGLTSPYSGLPGQRTLCQMCAGDHPGVTHTRFLRVSQAFTGNRFADSIFSSPPL